MHAAKSFPGFAPLNPGYDVQKKPQHRVGVGLRLLHIGDVRGLEHGDPGARNVRADELVAFERGRRILPAGDDQRRRGDLRQ